MTPTLTGTFRNGEAAFLVAYRFAVPAKRAAPPTMFGVAPRKEPAAFAPRTSWILSTGDVGVTVAGRVPVVVPANAVPAPTVAFRLLVAVPVAVVVAKPRLVPARAMEIDPETSAAAWAPPAVPNRTAADNRLRLNRFRICAPFFRPARGLARHLSGVWRADLPSGPLPPLLPLSGARTPRV